MINRQSRRIKSVVGDGAYDTRKAYDAAEDLGAKVLVPPNNNSRVKENGSTDRNKTVRRVKKVGRQKWKKEAGYHRQGKVENTSFRFKKIIGPGLSSRIPETQETESMLACHILNKFFKLGRPKSVKIMS